MLDAPLPTLNSARLRLRSPDERDRAALLAGLQTADLPNWFEAIQPPIDDALVDRMLAGDGAVERWLIEDKEHRAFQGMVALHLATGSGDYVSYWLVDAARGQGYASEAVSALLDHALIERRMSALLSTVHDGNEASHALMRRLNFDLVRPCQLKDRTGSLYRMTQRAWRRR